MARRGPKSLGVLSIVISLMVVAFIIVIAMELFGGGKGEEQDVIKKPIDRAHVVQCRTQIRSLTIAIESFYIQHGRYPDDLSEIEDISADQRLCPVTKTEYQYDSETHKVTCQDHPE